jgi:hypothetical protein
MRKILILSANPSDMTRLRVDEEVREIQEGLRRSRDRVLAEAFQTGIEGARYGAFMAAESIRLGEDWAVRIDRKVEWRRIRGSMWSICGGICGIWSSIRVWRRRCGDW